MGKRKTGFLCAGVICILAFAVVFASVEEKKTAQKKEVSASEEMIVRDLQEAEEKEAKEETERYEEEELTEVFRETEAAEAYQPKGELLLSENFDYAEDTFGFDKASLKEGALRLTERVQSSETSVKLFDHVIMGQSFVDVSFVLGAEFTNAKGRSGLEFRDLYGRLIFAVSCSYNEKTKQHELLYSAEGSANISTQTFTEPKWKKLSYTPGETYHISFLADFIRGSVDAFVRDEDGRVAGSIKGADVEASGLAKMVAGSYQTSGTSVVLTVDDFKLYGPDDAGEFPLAGKSLIAFGDSIVDGHLYKEAGFVEFLAAKEGMELLGNYANNGARIMPGSVVNPADGLGGTILDCQVEAAASENKNPDYIIFDGGANDAYSDILKKLGKTADTDTKTFAGAFRNTVLAMRRHWPDAKIVYVAVHKLSVRETNVQEELRKLELSICADMGVEVADLYQIPWDTSNAGMNQKYAFDAFDAGRIPVAGENTTGAHPNFLAIEEFYVPIVSDAAKRAKPVSASDYEMLWTEGETEGAASPDGETGNAPKEEGGLVASIKFSPSSYQIAAGRKVTLEPQIAPDTAANKKLNWKIMSNEAYASIDLKKNKCEVTTEAEGAGKTVSIMAEAADGSGTEKEVRIKLMKNAVTKVGIKEKHQILKAGEKTVLLAAVKTDGKNANRKLEWTADSELVTLKPAKNTSRCVVTAKAAGAGKTVTITARSTDGTDEFAQAVIRIK